MQRGLGCAILLMKGTPSSWRRDAVCSAVRKKDEEREDPPMADTMRGVYTNLTEIRRNVFCEVAKIAYEGGDDQAKKLDELPYKIIPGDVATYRESVFLERAIVGERRRPHVCRCRASILPEQLSAASPSAWQSRDLLPAAPHQHHHGCLQHARTTSAAFFPTYCQGCTPAMRYPKGAITFVDRGPHRPGECIHCGQCAKVCVPCPFSTKNTPLRLGLRHACIGSDEHGRADRLREVRLVRTVSSAARLAPLLTRPDASR